VIDSSPVIGALTYDLHEHLVQAPLPLPNAAPGRDNGLLTESVSLRILSFDTGLQGWREPNHVSMMESFSVYVLF
jgi:hypothetical protein